MDINGYSVNILLYKCLFGVIDCMSLYEKCLAISDKIDIDNAEEISLMSIEDKIEYRKTYSKTVYYISDIHLVHHIQKDLPENATDDMVIQYIKDVVTSLLHRKYIFSSILHEYNWNKKNVMFLFCGDISSCFEISKLFYSFFMEGIEKIKKLIEDNNLKAGNIFVYAVLGNHEYWEFKNKKECCDTFENLFNSIGIKFLNNTIEYFGNQELPKSFVGMDDKGRACYDVVNKEDDEKLYNECIRRVDNTLIVGGTGFAGFNNKFNANNGIYRDTISRDEEIIETYNWNEVYNAARKKAKEENCKLIVLTHNPIEDWKENKNIDSSSVYFNGHTHRNLLYREEDRNIFIFSDNQIGYKKSDIQFKKANTSYKVNPYIDLEDGFYETNSQDYLCFYDNFTNDYISGNGKVDNVLKKGTAKFYVIKKSGYYGFFLVSKSGISICAGGRIKNIKKKGSIEEIYRDFSDMISIYLKAVSPYRSVQERVSNAVKSFGGSGKIHGCIVDIDFLNHIMINPSDGTVTYYNSPDFGIIKRSKDLKTLLEKHNKELSQRYIALLDLAKGEEKNELVLVNQLKIDDEDFINIDIKNSVYALSNRLNQIQRLFDCKILRDWNEDLLHKEDNNILGIPEKIE